MIKKYFKNISQADFNNLPNKLLKIKLFTIGFIIAGSTIALSVKPLAAAPDITSISGTLTHGSAVTITGTGFGTKTPAAPRVWTNFENGTMTPTALGTATSWERTSGMSVSTQNQEINSTYNTRGIVNPDGSSPNVGFIVNYANAANTEGFTKVYTFVRRYYDDATWWSVMAGQFHNYKYFRIWTNPVGTTTVYPNSYFLVGNTVPVIRFVTEGSACKAGDDTDWGPGTTTPPAQQWLREEYTVSRANGTGVAKQWTNGILIKNLSNLYTASGLCSPSPYTDSWISLSIENFWTLVGPPLGAYVYFDDIYIDNTWARVMIGDQNTFDASTHREIQIPSAWSGTSITITLNQGSFTNFNSTYLYIIDSDGNVNTNGYPLCPTCPKTPTGLQIQ